MDLNACKERIGYEQITVSLVELILKFNPTIEL